MTAASQSTGTGDLTQECRVLCRYLISRQPTDYIIEKYAEAHRVGTVLAGNHRRFQRTLVRFASRGSLAARLADSYASLFCRAGLLRRKLVLLLAILESTAPTHTDVDTVIPGSRAGLVLHLAWRVAGFALAAALATLLLAPVHIAQSRGGGGA